MQLTKLPIFREGKVDKLRSGQGGSPVANL